MDSLAVIRRQVNWVDWLLLGGVIRQVVAGFETNERVLAAAKGRFFVRTMNSLPRERGPGLLVVTSKRVFILGFLDKTRTPFEIPKKGLLKLQDLCPDDPPSEKHTVEVMTEIECFDGSSLSGRDTLTFSFALSSNAAREVDAAAQMLSDEPEG